MAEEQNIVEGASQEPQGNPEGNAPVVKPFEETYKEKFGDIPLDELHTTYTSAQEIQNQVQEAQSRAEQLAKENEALKNTDPFASPYLKQLNDLVKSGASAQQVEAFNRMQGINPDENSPEENMKLYYQLKSGFTPQEAEDLISSKYKINESDYPLSPDLEDDELEKAKAEVQRKIRIEKTRLKADVGEATQYLKSQKAEVSKPLASDDERKEKWEANLKKAETLAPQLSASFKELKVQIGTEESPNEISFDVSKDEEYQKALPELTKQFFQATGVMVEDVKEGGKVNPADLTKYAQNTYIIKNFPRLLAEAYKKGLTAQKQTTVEGKESNGANTILDKKPDGAGNGSITLGSEFSKKMFPSSYGN